MLDVRRHNEGTIYFRADRRAKVAAVILPGGRRATAMCPHRDHRERDRDCRESRDLLDGLLAQRDVGKRDPRRIRLGPYLLRWIEHRMDPRLAYATRRQHEMIVRRHLVPNLGRFTLAELGPADVDAYLARTDLDPQTLRHHRATLRRALEDARRDRLIPDNAASLAKAPVLPDRERTTLDFDQVRRLLDTTEGHRLRALWAVGATCGLRLSEALGLAWSDVDLDRRTLRVNRTLARQNGKWVRTKPKTRKSRRDVPLTPLAVAALVEHRAIQDAERGDHPRPIDALVFTTTTGQPIHGTNVLPELRRALEAAGLPRLTYHDLRHSAATMMFAAGVPLPVIADILGHSTVRITADLYRHKVSALVMDAADMLQARLAGGQG